MQRVIGVVRSRDESRVWIEVDQSGCGRCSEPGGCGGVSIAQSLCSSKRQICVGDTLGLAPGDRVVVAIPDRVLVRSVTAVYVVPLAMGVGVAAVVHALFGDRGAALIDLGGFVAGLVVSWWWLTRLKWGESSSPVVLEKSG